ncbi:hypothetical protein JTE90_021588 [Oedothorax gibbosus]|uniref:Uncharacterized protein n=1 Tax=Oedothorax gibbosus TaxID=931172 RepID=A0AAV6VPC3_9ARAC|nr:hypothetical protein JTE90_021588 [Oedothorax gibbosus]
MWRTNSQNLGESRSHEVSVLGYVAVCIDTFSGICTMPSRHFRTTLLSALKLLENCILHAQKPAIWFVPSSLASAPLSWQQQRLLWDDHFLDTTPNNL